LLGVLYTTGVYFGARAILKDVDVTEFNWTRVALVPLGIFMGVAEESMMRGFFMNELQKARVAVWLQIVASGACSAVYHAIHNPTWEGFLPSFVLFTLHHPPVADIQTRVHVDHNPRPNELALAEVLKAAAQSSRARFVVTAGHIHNYERFLQDDIVYLVSGGGGAVPYEVDRTPRDQYQGIEFPNYHYVKMTVAGGKLTGEMYRLDEPAAPAAHFTRKDTFELNARGIQLDASR